jgi:hypothetical protein
MVRVVSPRIVSGKTALTSLAALLLLSLTSSLSANTIAYNALPEGVHMTYTGVQETSMSAGDTAPLFGAPTISGDSIVFLSMSFTSQASNGAVDITDGKLEMTIESKNNPDWYIDRLYMREFGDTTLVGSGGTSLTKSTAACHLILSILEVDRVATWVPVGFDMTMSEGGVWTMNQGVGMTAHGWNGIWDQNVTTLLQNYGGGHATKVQLTFDNTLTTSSELNTSAYIAKKAVGLQVTPLMVGEEPPIPEPATLGMMAVGAMALLARKRK